MKKPREKLLLLPAALLAVGAGLRAQAPGEKAAPASAAAEETSPQARQFANRGFDLLGTHDARGAEAAFRKAIAVEPTLASAHRGLALALWAEGRGSAALGELKAATELDPNDADSHLDLGKLAWDLSAKAGANSPGELAGRRRPDEYLELAASELALAAKLRPKDADVRLSLAEVEIEAQRPQDAVRAATEAAGLNPSSGRAHVVLGRAYLAAGEDVKAVSEAKEALRLNSADAEADYLLGQIAWMRKNSVGAEAEFRNAIRAQPDFAPAYSALAEVMMDRGRPGDARPLLEKALSLDPADWQSEYRLAMLVSESGETKRALDLLDDVLRRNPGFLPAKEQLGMALVRRGELAAATARAQAIEAENPSASEGHHLMALILWKQRDLDGSLAECAQALAAQPDSAALLALQSLELWRQGRKKEARAIFAAAAKRDPRLGTSQVFCRLILCDARDIGPVEEFLQKNRWLLAPPPSP